MCDSCCKLLAAAAASSTLAACRADLAHSLRCLLTRLRLLVLQWLLVLLLLAWQLTLLCCCRLAG